MKETYDLVASSDTTLFGAAGTTTADAIILFREAIDSYAATTGISSVNALKSELDLVFVRE